MNRSDRRRAQRAQQREPDPSKRDFFVRPDFDMDIRGGEMQLLLQGPVRHIFFLVDGKLQRFQEIKLGGMPIPKLANDLAWSGASSMLFHHRNDPEIHTTVIFSMLNLREAEAFYSDDSALQGALWLANAPMSFDAITSLQRLRPYVPTYSLMKGLTHIRVRDCVDFLIQAASHPELRDALNK